ncbi:hypothetical protein FD754_018615 [Muntiacus muntjak]|uniref:Groucho/TLE N-terminal Q-rich domain-containing protein n=1 Tax=Muntiacus muntjak TaxID=9888 RepID=A0A5N3UY23_MUNMU|nr:hypothetical protein FD754_018615 [Muntiacus muntjak]
MSAQSRHSGWSHTLQQLKFTTSDPCDLIKDEFQLLQAQYHSLKLECDKLASKKPETQHHYQAEIFKGLNGISQQFLGTIQWANKQVAVSDIGTASSHCLCSLAHLSKENNNRHDGGTHQKDDGR